METKGEKEMFFTVKKAISIAGKVHIPCVCYAVNRINEYTVKELEKQGKAEIHSEKVFFQNGKILKKASKEIVIEKPKKERKEKREKVIVEEKEESKEEMSLEDF